MKIPIIIIFSFFVATIFWGCKKDDELRLPEKLQFVDLRQSLADTPFVIIDDSIAMATTVKLKSNIILSAAWEHGIYLGPIMKTRLLWANSKSGLNFIMVGFNDLFYQKLIQVKNDGASYDYDIAIITLLNAELRRQGSLIWFKFNNSWTRTGLIPDSEMQISLN
ncbi:MAG: hypothetical protein WCN88_04620 [Candidatus Falkowbacteria bacterium]